MSLTFIHGEGQRSRLEILVDEPYTFTADVYEGDLPVALDDGATKVRIQSPGGGDLVAKTATGVSVGAGEDGSTTNRISYTLDASTNDTRDENFILTWYAVRDSETAEHERRVLFDVCITTLVNVVREEDLFEFAPGLRTERSGMSEGTANSSGGSTTTLVDDALEIYPDNWFNGGVIELLNGDDEGERRRVTDFAESTGTATFDPALSAAPDGDAYRIRRSWQHLIDLAYEDVKSRIRERGNRSALVVDAGELYRPIVYRAIQLCYESIGSLMGESPSSQGVADSPAWDTAEHYKRLYDEAFTSTHFHYDAGADDGVPDSVLSFATVRSARR